MGEFFKPWRRKIGVVTLLMACVFMGGWLRSFKIREFVDVDLAGATYRLGSTGGEFKLIYVTPAAGQGLAWHTSEQPVGEKNEDRWHNYQMEWELNCAFFNFGTGTLHANIRATVFAFPYWFIVIPLTLISLWLLLSKPRKSTPKKITEPIPVAGA